MSHVKQQNDNSV